MLNISDVSIKLNKSRTIVAYVSIVLDNSFIVHDIKIVNGNKGLLVIMPSRKLYEKCVSCFYPNTENSNFCNFCGKELTSDSDHNSSKKIDIAHPINNEFRLHLQKQILDKYLLEINKNS